MPYFDPEQFYWDWGSQRDIRNSPQQPFVSDDEARTRALFDQEKSSKPARPTISQTFQSGPQPSTAPSASNTNIPYFLRPATETPSWAPSSFPQTEQPNARSTPYAPLLAVKSAVDQLPANPAFTGSEDPTGAWERMHRRNVERTALLAAGQGPSNFNTNQLPGEKGFVWHVLNKAFAPERLERQLQREETNRISVPGTRENWEYGIKQDEYDLNTLRSLSGLSNERARTLQTQSETDRINQEIQFKRQADERRADFQKAIDEGNINRAAQLDPERTATFLSTKTLNDIMANPALYKAKLEKDSGFTDKRATDATIAYQRSNIELERKKLELQVKTLGIETNRAIANLVPSLAQDYGFPAGAAFLFSSYMHKAIELPDEVRDVLFQYPAIIRTAQNYAKNAAAGTEGAGASDAPKIIKTYTDALEGLSRASVLEGLDPELKEQVLSAVFEVREAVQQVFDANRPPSNIKALPTYDPSKPPIQPGLIGTSPGIFDILKMHVLGPFSWRPELRQIDLGTREAKAAIDRPPGAIGPSFFGAFTPGTTVQEERTIAALEDVAEAQRLKKEDYDRKMLIFDRLQKK